MNAPMPKCLACGAQMRHLFTASPVHFRAAGFYATEYGHLEGQVGKTKAAKLRRYRDDVERRAKAGRLTPYEQALETAERIHP